MARQIWFERDGSLLVFVEFSVRYIEETELVSKRTEVEQSILIWTGKRGNVTKIEGGRYS